MNRNTMVAAVTLALGASAIAPQALAQANGVLYAMESGHGEVLWNHARRKA